MPVFIYFYLYCPMEGKKRRFMAMSALRPIFYLGGLSVLRWEKKIRWLSLHLLPHLKSCMVQVTYLTYRTAGTLRLEWRGGLAVHAEGPHALVDPQSDDLRSFTKPYSTGRWCSAAQKLFLLFFFFKRRVFRLLKIFSDVSKLCLN